MNKSDLKKQINLAIPSGIENAVDAADVRNSINSVVDNSLFAEDLASTVGSNTLTAMSQKAVTDELMLKVDEADLADVAKSGDYNDLINTPIFPSTDEFVTTDELATALNPINTKLTTISDGAEVNVQADWNEVDSISDAFIKNKPIIPVIDDLATVEYVDEVAKLEQDVTPIGISNVGNITPSTVIPAGTTLDEFVRMLLVKLVDVRAINPTATLNVSPLTTDIYEVGSDLSVSLSTNYVDGRFVGADATYSYNLVAGCSEDEVTYYLNNAEISNPTVTISLTNNGANQAFKAVVNHGASTALPVKNDGTSSLVNIVAGTITTPTLTYQARYRYFIGTLGDYTRTDFSNLTLEELKSLSETENVNDNWLNPTGSTDIPGTFVTEAESGSIIIACPSDYNLTRVYGMLGESQSLIGSFSVKETFEYSFSGVNYTAHILPINVEDGNFTYQGIQLTKI